MRNATFCLSSNCQMIYVKWLDADLKYKKFEIRKWRTSEKRGDEFLKLALLILHVRVEWRKNNKLLMLFVICIISPTKQTL